jgi:hypothetical protein
VANVFTVKLGDDFPQVQTTLTSDDGMPIDLSDAISVEFQSIKVSTGSTAVSGAAVVDDDENGIIRYVWQGTDTDVPGTYWGSWVVQWPGGQQTFPSIGYDIIEIEGADVTLQAWATVNDVRALTGANVNETQVLQAQTIIELWTGKVWSAADAASIDGIWLKRAVAYQTSYLVINPNITTSQSYKSITQGDNTVVYRDEFSTIILAPLAKIACQRLQTTSSKVYHVDDGTEVDPCE